MNDNATLVRKALKLEYATVAWNSLEAIASIAAGIMARSIALVGFGLDSGIEIVAALALVWRLRKHGVNNTDEESSSEKRVLLIIGITFFLLAAYVSVESIRSLWLRQVPRESPIGIAVTLLAAVIMPALAIAKRRIATLLGSKALAAEATESLVCALLSGIVLSGLVLNALFGLWWADPAAGLIMVGFVLKEGWEALEESRDYPTTSRPS